MTSDVAIRVRDVSKRYRVFDSERARLAHAMWRHDGHGLHEIAALDGVSFEVKRGESFGVIGRNGGGKSTLLQILTGVLRPTTGDVEVKGRVSALLELGSGFHPEYTGRDNVILNGLLLGLTRDEILARFADIAAFADIGEAIDRPVKTYSTGMVLRLAYAVQAMVDPDILVIDEALSVGDFFFQQKCFAHLRSLRARGATIVFVSHDMGSVRDLCEQALYLRQGRVQFVGESYVAIRHYLAERGGETAPEAIAAPAADYASPGEFEAILRDAAWTAPGRPADRPLIAVALYDDAGAPARSLGVGATMRIKVAYRPAPGVPTHVTAVIRNRYDQVVTSLGSAQLELAPPASNGDRPVIFELRLRLAFEAGNYSLLVALAQPVGPNQGRNLDSTDAIGPIAIQWDYERDRAPFLGMFGPEAAGSFRLHQA